MKKLLVLASLLVVGQANAASFTFSGNIQYHNDVIQIGFTLNSDATNVRVWTDSFQSATNFDPITALWNADTGALIDENDDNPSIALGQTWFDSGFVLPSISAGNYIFTVATFNNWAAGTNLSNGFTFDSQTPISLAVWNQPASHVNMGTFWQVHLDGVDSATPPVSPVPVPAAAFLFAPALLGFVGLRRKAKKA